MKPFHTRNRNCRCVNVDLLDDSNSYEIIKKFPFAEQGGCVR